MTYAPDTSNLQQLLATHRQTIHHYTNQYAMHGSAYVPPFIIHGIREACSSVRRIKDALSESGVVVEENFNDNADLVSFSESIGLAYNPKDRYATAQYEAYCDIWRVLQRLRISGDVLWEYVTHENIVVFASEFRRVTEDLGVHAIFLEDEHYEQLKKLLEAFGWFRVGKIRLFEIMNREKNKYIIDSLAQEQIFTNRHMKSQYETLLENIRAAFHNKLAKYA